jgi:hypothetical protein
VWKTLGIDVRRRSKGVMTHGRAETVPAGIACAIDVPGDLSVIRFGFGARGVTRAVPLGCPASSRRRPCGAARSNSASASSTQPAPTVDSVSEELSRETVYRYPGDVVIAATDRLECTAPGQWPVNRASESLVNVCKQEQIAYPPWALIQDPDGNRSGHEMVQGQRHSTEASQIVIALLPARSLSILSIPGTGPGSHLYPVAATAIRLLPAEDASCPATAGVWPRRPGPGR